ncbi:MAG: lipopolysaccharide assembly protein LapA domain-containing protein [Alphaproteobacteria bacterium]
MRFVTWIVGVPLAIVATIFAVANRGMVALDLWPLPFMVDVPVFLAVLAALLVGLLTGALMSWVSAGRLRARLRERNARIADLERDLTLATSRATLPTAETP